VTRALITSIAGYASFFWGCFWLFAYWTFPYDRVATYITDMVDNGSSGYTIDIGELSPYWLTGVELEDVKLRKKGGTDVAMAGDASAKDDGFQIKEARARVGILPLLIGNRSVSFDAVLAQGAIDGEFEDAGDQKHVAAELSKVDFGKLGILDAVLPLPVKGEVGGEFDLTIGTEAKDTAGAAKLQIRGLTIGDGKAKLKVGGMGGLTIDPIEAGTVTLELDVKEGVGTVKKLSCDGKDIELEGVGEVRFGNPIERSRLDILLSIKFTDAYKNKSSRTTAMFALLDGSSVPQVRSARTPDGALQYRLSGSLTSVRATPSGRTNMATKRNAGGAAPRPARPDRPPSADDDEDDEE
jgi:type II secretion system protein N